MPKALCKIDFPQYRGLFPDWSGPRPWRFFLMASDLSWREAIKGGIMVKPA